VGSERRAHPRFACDLDVEVSAGGATTLNARTIDISRNGICMVVPAAIPPGSDVTLGLRLLFEGAESDLVQLPAKTVWCTDTEGSFQVGAVFSGLTPQGGQSLDVLLKFLSGQVELPSA
jgi:hypothetical protein